MERKTNGFGLVKSDKMAKKYNLSKEASTPHAGVWKIEELKV